LDPPYTKTCYELVITQGIIIIVLKQNYFKLLLFIFQRNENVCDITLCLQYFFPSEGIYRGKSSDVSRFRSLSG